MIRSTWYVWSDSDDKVIDLFRKGFKNNMQGAYGTTGCYGSYGSTYESGKEFYFALGAETKHFEKAIEYFNNTFKNIEIVLLDVLEMVTAANSINGEFNIPKEISLKDNSRIINEFSVYLMKIVFSPKYEDHTKYVLRIPIGFWIRIYSDYHSSRVDRLTITENISDYIREAIIYSNSKVGRNGSLMTDYPNVTYSNFMSFDTPELMNTLFSKTLIVNTEWGFSSLEYEHNILPRTVYTVINHPKYIYKTL